MLTYDDALYIHLNMVIPALNAYHLKATFYLITSRPAVIDRMQEWRAASKKGHELGNHTLYHPCNGNLLGCAWVEKENDLTNYTAARAVKETRTANQLLKAIDGKTERTFAYHCGDLKIGDSFYWSTFFI